MSTPRILDEVGLVCGPFLNIAVLPTEAARRLQKSAASAVSRSSDIVVATSSQGYRWNIMHEVEDATGERIDTYIRAFSIPRSRELAKGSSLKTLPFFLAHDVAFKHHELGLKDVNTPLKEPLGAVTRSIARRNETADAQPPTPPSMMAISKCTQLDFGKFENETR